LLGKNHKLTVALLIGGVSYEEQNKKLDRGADVVIATPGRLLDHLERGKLLLNSIEILVVDEADRMLDMGFIPDIERICKVLPFTRQTLFFSATMPPEIQRLADNFLHTPERIEVARPASAATTITQRLKKAADHPAEKREALRSLIREHEIKNAIIFCNRKKDVGVVFRSLQRHGFNVGALHGDMDQRQRMATLDAFRNGEISLLAASDVAARGLDIPEVSHVFNYDVPVHPEDYVHRIGRTGRAGREGYAAMLVTPRDHKALKAIEALLREEIAWVDGAPDPADIEEARTAGRENGRGRRRGGRARRSGQKSADAETSSGHRNGAAKENGTQEPKRSRSARKSEETGARPENKSSARSKQPSKARSAPNDKSAPKDKSRSGQGRDNQPVGMGDHVPAFMMRPVRAG
ncbi:MAG: DEAD/DEAH box helicase, partial [Pseudomonadota bacterium]